jgi:transposase
MMALYLKSLGVPHKDICADLSISHVCLAEYLDRYTKEGLDGLRRLGYKGKRNILNENRDLIIAHLEANPPGTLKEARARIEEITGIRRSLPQIQVFLKKNTSCEEK